MGGIVYGVDGRRGRAVCGTTARCYKEVSEGLGMSPKTLKETSGCHRSVGSLIVATVFACSTKQEDSVAWESRICPCWWWDSPCGAVQCTRWVEICKFVFMVDVPLFEKPSNWIEIEHPQASRVQCDFKSDLLKEKKKKTPSEGKPCMKGNSPVGIEVLSIVGHPDVFETKSRLLLPPTRNLPSKPSTFIWNLSSYVRILNPFMGFQHSHLAPFDLEMVEKICISKSFTGKEYH